ncbi:hypothetical protein P3342_000519 [Pyrenophora teres f. teres]|nr:hypothetical protein P3342_000519 [Pyrenophora teres f. teres]
MMLEYYQTILVFSILTVTGSSLLVTPANAFVAYWFNTRRGLASGVAFVGGSFGGVISPILFLLCGTSVTLCRSRLPPRNGAAKT